MRESNKEWFKILVSGIGTACQWFLVSILSILTISGIWSILSGISNPDSILIFMPDTDIAHMTQHDYCQYDELKWPIKDQYCQF